jgi:sulfur-oxidizing protein SoxY
VGRWAQRHHDGVGAAGQYPGVWLGSFLAPPGKGLSGRCRANDGKLARPYKPPMNPWAAGPLCGPCATPGDEEMHHRRDMLAGSAAVAGLLAGLGLLPGAARANTLSWAQAAFEAKSLNEALKALGSAAPVESKDVSLSGPDIAENGAVVPLGVATTLPGVKRLLVLVEKNPAVLAAAFDVSDAIDASFSTRVKMGQSSSVYAVALLADGRALFAQKDIKVTLGGCGG